MLMELFLSRTDKPKVPTLYIFSQSMSNSFLLTAFKSYYIYNERVISKFQRYVSKSNFTNTINIKFYYQDLEILDLVKAPISFRPFLFIFCCLLQRIFCTVWIIYHFYIVYIAIVFDSEVVFQTF